MSTSYVSPHQKKVEVRDAVRITNFFCRARLWLLGLLSESKRLSTWASRGMTSQQRSGGWARGRHVRQKELARSVRRREGARTPHARGRRGRSCVRRPETSSSVRQTEHGLSVCLVDKR